MRSTQSSRIANGTLGADILGGTGNDLLTGGGSDFLIISADCGSEATCKFQSGGVLPHTLEIVVTSPTSGTLALQENLQLLLTAETAVIDNPRSVRAARFGAGTIFHERPRHIDCRRSGRSFRRGMVVGDVDNDLIDRNQERG